MKPDERHDGRENEVLANRVRVYERARRKHPNRWSRGTRNWTPAPAVFLNPKRDQEPSPGRSRAPVSTEKSDNSFDTHRDLGSLARLYAYVEQAARA